ncbi:MAG TPA: AraC family transcriptional regulator [Chloroflexi bacterium]|nr:AraC family transcriptional regulator [Chloroflexota bacterium]
MLDAVVISQAIDFIEDNLRENIAVADVADAVSYSLYYFCRAFNQVTHLTPYDYLIRRRLAMAARALLETDRKVIDVALDYQFNNPETFSRAFKRVFGTSPSGWRKRGRLDEWDLMPRLTLAHLEHIAKGDYLKPVPVTQEAVRVAGVMTWVQERRRSVSDLWHLLADILVRREIAHMPGAYYGISMRASQEMGGFLYLAAVELAEGEIGDAALVVKEIPALGCVRFVHKGPGWDLPLTLDYVYHTWLPKSGLRPSVPWTIEQSERNFCHLDEAPSERAVYVPVDRQ